MNLRGKTVLITGGASGIGWEFARQLLARQNTVLVAGRDPERLAAARQALPGLEVFTADVSDPRAVTALHQQVLARFPALDILVNNAGWMRNLDLLAPRELPDLTRELGVNLCGPIWMTHQFLPALRSRPQAAIVNVSSGLAFVPLPSSPVYSAAKAALHSFTRSLRAQLAGTAIQVFELAPPAVDTSLIRGKFPSTVKSMRGMPAAGLVARALAAIEADVLEIRPGLSGFLHLMNRVAPALTMRRMEQLAHTARF